MKTTLKTTTKIPASDIAIPAIPAGRNRNPRPVKGAVARTQMYIRMLSRVNGVTAHEMAVAAANGSEKDVGDWAGDGLPTHHNSWSLTKLAWDYGFDLYFMRKDGSRYMTYQFVPYGAPPTAFMDKAELSEYRAKTKAVKAPAKAPVTEAPASDDSATS